MPISKRPSERGDLVLRFRLVFPAYLTDAKKRQIRLILAGEIPEEDGVIPVDVPGTDNQETAE